MKSYQDQEKHLTKEGNYIEAMKIIFKEDMHEETWSNSYKIEE